jgi:hypothetical protein
MSWALDIFQTQIEQTYLLVQLLILVQMQNLRAVSNDILSNELNFCFSPEFLDLC